MPPVATPDLTSEITHTAVPPPDIQYMPPGRHTIHATRDGEPVTVTVDVNPATADTLQTFLQERLELAAQGLDDRPYLDFNHDDREASAWPLRFYWAGEDPIHGGVRVKVEWTGAGSEAITSKTFRRFSPTFHIDDQGKVTASETNMGGLVNRAAFKRIQPLFASSPSPSPSSSPPERSEVPPQRDSSSSSSSPLPRRSSTSEGGLPPIHEINAIHGQKKQSLSPSPSPRIHPSNTPPLHPSPLPRHNSPSEGESPSPANHQPSTINHPPSAVSAARTYANPDTPTPTARDTIHGPPPPAPGQLRYNDSNGNLAAVVDGDTGRVIWRNPNAGQWVPRTGGDWMPRTQTPPPPRATPSHVQIPDPGEGHTTRLYDADHDRSNALRERSIEVRQRNAAFNRLAEHFREENQAAPHPTDPSTRQKLRQDRADALTPEERAELENTITDTLARTVDTDTLDQLTEDQRHLLTDRGRSGFLGPYETEAPRLNGLRLTADQEAYLEHLIDTGRQPAPEPDPADPIGEWIRHRLADQAALETLFGNFTTFDGIRDFVEHLESTDTPPHRLTQPQADALIKAFRHRIPLRDEHGAHYTPPLNTEEETSLRAALRTLRPLFASPPASPYSLNRYSLNPYRLPPPPSTPASPLPAKAAPPASTKAATTAPIPSASAPLKCASATPPCAAPPKPPPTPPPPPPKTSKPPSTASPKAASNPSPRSNSKPSPPTPKPPSKPPAKPSKTTPPPPIPPTSIPSSPPLSTNPSPPSSTPSKPKVSTAPPSPPPSPPTKKPAPRPPPTSPPPSASPKATSPPPSKP